MHNLYSNSFLHYTKKQEFLNGIIKDGFKVSFSREEMYDGTAVGSVIGIPTVCFCDIPLSCINSVHYKGDNGEYFCIAMSRRWGGENGLLPVLYYPNNKDCLSTKTVMRAVRSFTNARNKATMYQILGYAKPTKKLRRPNNKKYSDNNYIEREWRKVYASIGDCKWQNEDENDNYRSIIPKPFVGPTLKFTVSDIDFIVVNKKNITALINFIRTLTQIGGNYSIPTCDDKNLLISKIIIFESLKFNM